MSRVFKMFLLSMLIAASLAACKKAQEESAEAAKETITDMKANIDSAKEAAAGIERAAKDTAEAAEKAGADAAGDEAKE